jgi:hypothetical protein
VQRVCRVCGIEYGVKPPEGDLVTNWLCRGRLPGELKRIGKELAAPKMALSEVEQERR